MLVYKPNPSHHNHESVMSTKLTIKKLTYVAVAFGIASLCSCSSSTSTLETAATTGTEAPTESNEPMTEPEVELEATPPGKVLRHAVFFSFKESASEADVQSVTDAFRALPAKIDAITEFQSGTNNSPEGKDDGFTHCFLLTFKDAAGRAEYIPHPAHSGEFADVLRPHMDKVFVIDYWGTPYEPMEKELKHAVFFKFKDDADPAAVEQVEQAFAALPSKISSIKQFEWGKNNSPESHDHGFTHCFMVTFDSDEGRQEYLPHADHMAFVEVLLPVLDKVRVLDFWGDRPE